ncbi:MAG: hypothetical protein WCG95_00650 [bacterium]
MITSTPLIGIGKSLSSKVHYAYVKDNPMTNFSTTLLRSGTYKTRATQSGKPTFAHKVGHFLKGEAYKLKGETYYNRLVNFAEKCGFLPQSRFGKA